jgi:hypothetical protein
MEETLYIHDLGSVIAVLIEHQNKQNVIERFWSFVNHGAIDFKTRIIETGLEGFHWIEENNSPFRGFFYTDKEKLLKSLISGQLFKILNENSFKYKGKYRGAMDEAIELGYSYYYNIPDKDFVNINKAKNSTYYKYSIPTFNESYE